MNIRYYTPTLYLDDILIRKSPPAYQDGVYEPAGQDRPNPFTISGIAHKGKSGLGSVRNRTAMLVYFGETFDLSYKALWKTTNLIWFLFIYLFILENFQVRIFFSKCVATYIILKNKLYLYQAADICWQDYVRPPSPFLPIKLHAFPTAFYGGYL